MRVLISLVSLLVLATAASLFALREVLLSRIDNQVQTSLTAQVNALRTMIDGGVDPRDGSDFNGDLSEIFDVFTEIESPLEGGVLVGYEDGSLQAARSDLESPGALIDALAPLAAVQAPASGELETAQGPARYVAVPVVGNKDGGTFIAARLLDTERDEVESAIRIAIGVSIVATLLASLFIWLAAGRVMAPLRELAQTTRKINETDLTRRVQIRGGTEIADLGRTYNDMLDRLESAFADQKEFLADVGHELRTPITIIRGHLETLGDDPVERRHATAVIDEELDRMNRLVDDLLLLARSDRPDFLRPEPLDLDLLTSSLLGKARTLGDRDWRFDAVGVGLMRADPHRLTSAVMNLAQNGVRHTRPGDVIALGTSIGSGHARLWVRDEGEGIPVPKQERVFERFTTHGDEVAGGGAGLGLAIVKAIAEAHGGHVELVSSPGRGSTFTIVIPTSEPRDEES